LKRLLFIAYHFPPTGGAGTQRSVKFVRDLPHLGYEPVVLTGPGQLAGQWTPADDTLAHELPAGLEIVRVAGSPEPATTSRARRARWLGQPGPFADWWGPGAASAALHVAAVRPVDAIFATMSPYESGAVASALARTMEIPWVADLRDPWALDEMQAYPTALQRRRELMRMRRVLRTADAIVMNTPEAARRLTQAFPELAVRNVVVIPNGWDSGEFHASPPPVLAPDNSFRIVHTGSLHTAMGRRRRAARARRLLGGAQDVDVLPRSHVFLLAAIRRLRERDPAAAARVELHLAGVTTVADRESADDPSIRLHGYLPHAASVQLVRSADLLFLPMHELPPGRRATIVPGKTYEYLAAGRPILAAVPDGDARDLVETAPGSVVCRPRDVEAMTETLARVVSQRMREGRMPDRHSPALPRYERRRLSGELGRVLDAVLGVTPDRGRARLTLVS
jgi:glycosyltransferase involved in cell wall biosynthesis